MSVLILKRAPSFFHHGILLMPGFRFNSSHSFSIKSTSFTKSFMNETLFPKRRIAIIICLILMILKWLASDSPGDAFRNLHLALTFLTRNTHPTTTKQNMRNTAMATFFFGDTRTTIQITTTARKKQLWKNIPCPTRTKARHALRCKNCKA